MQKTQVCMFCRYRRTLSDVAGAGPCCAGPEMPRTKALDEQMAPRPARALPQRLRSPTHPDQAHR